MIVNKHSLLFNEPLSPMETDKMRCNGTSFGLTEAGYDIRVKQDLIFYPEDRFQLASSIELFHMPSHLVGVVHDKSTWARKGLSVFNTVIEPGWRGYLTLELVYHGQDSLVIKSGSGIAQVLFHTLWNNASYSGKYQDQPDKPVQAIYEG